MVHAGKLLLQWPNVYVKRVLLVQLVLYVINSYFPIVRISKQLKSLDDSCTRLPCKNGGDCTTLIADTGTNWSAYRCICPPGIYGQNCDTGAIEAKESTTKKSIFFFVSFSNKFLLKYALSEISNLQ